MDKSLEIWELFEDAVVQVATSSTSLTTITAVIARNAAVMAPIVKFAVETVRKVIGQSVKDLILTPPSPSPCGLDFSSDKSQKKCKNKALEKRNSRRRSSSRSSGKYTRLLKGSLRNTVISSTDSDISQERMDCAPEMKIQHFTDSHFRNVFSYKTYRLIIKS